MSNDRSSSAPLQPRVPSISIAFRTFGRTLKHGYDNLGTLALVSILWLVGAILIVPLGIVTAGLHRVTQPMTEERSPDWRDFYVHWREDFRWSTLLVAVLMFIWGSVVFNIWFYAGSSVAALRLLAILFATVLIIWFGVMLFTFPLALRQAEQHLRTTLRNAILMTLANAPGVLVSMLLLLVFSILLFVLPPLFLLLPGVIALWSAENTRLLLVASGYIAKDEFADRERISRR